jgi:hypothetical protein
MTELKEAYPATVQVTIEPSEVGLTVHPEGASSSTAAVIPVTGFRASCTECKWLSPGIDETFEASEEKRRAHDNVIHDADEPPLSYPKTPSTEVKICLGCGHAWTLHRNVAGCLHEECPCGVEADESAYAWSGRKPKGHSHE